MNVCKQKITLSTEPPSGRDRNIHFWWRHTELNNQVLSGAWTELRVNIRIIPINHFTKTRNSEDSGLEYEFDLERILAGLRLCESHSPTINIAISVSNQSNYFQAYLAFYKKKDE